MKNIRKSIHSSEHLDLRQIFIEKRKELGLSQRELAEKMGVIYSFIGKVETGDRRLDIIEFIDYCSALDLVPQKIITDLMNNKKDK